MFFSDALLFPSEGPLLPAPVGRLAPSPTGVLHLGNVRSFLLAWLSVRAQGGTILLRIEDIDGPRVKAESIEQTIELLTWLGLDWDGEPLIQSTRLAQHEAAIDRLFERGRIYPCICTRKEVEEAASAPHESATDGAPVDGAIYPGTCRGRFSSVEEARARSGRDPALRARVDIPALPFDDGFLGRVPGAIVGDFVVGKRDGTPSYQLAVVVDDADQGVTEVVRADDLVPSPPRQLLLYRELGRTPPAFTHVPLVVGQDGRRLAKRHGDTSVEHFRREGKSAEQIIGCVAALAGLLDAPRACQPSELIDAFAWDCVPRDPVVGEDPEFPSP